MRYMRVSIVCSGLVLLVLIIFFPRPLISNENSSLQRVDYEAYHESKQTEEKSIKISDETKQELLDFLSTCEIYQTLYPTNTVSARSTIGSDGFYLYIGVIDNEKSINIHVLNSYSCIVLENKPFFYYFINANTVENSICEILGVSP